ncbi:hypothetical protein V2J09_016905 [Rumex salicifolius]
MAATCRVPEIHGVSATTSLTSFEEDDSGLLRRKTPLQLQTLENLYSVDKYPTQSRMEDYAFALGLTYELVKGWFIERRRKEKSGGARSSRVKTNSKGSCKRKKKKKKNEEEENRSETESEAEQDESAMMKMPVQNQDRLYSSNYNLTKVFRKDGAPLGLEFSHIPSASQRRHPTTGSDLERCGSASDDEQRMRCTKRVTGPSSVDCSVSTLGASLNKHGKGKGFMTAWKTLNDQYDNQTTKRRKVLPSENYLPAKRHGMGKGLVTAWRAMHPVSESYTSVVSHTNGGTKVLQPLKSKPKKTVAQNKRQQKQKAPISWRRLGARLQDKKSSKRRRKADCGKNENIYKAHRLECRLALETVTSEDHCSSSAILVDDEELELRELQAGPNPLTCIGHFSTSARYSCPLCKGLLAKFPPDSVGMKQPFCKLPCEFSLEQVKKIFKVFHFLYTYAVIVDTCPFTMDEFIQAFHEKDSCLLGELHVRLLKLLLSDIAKELYAALPHPSKNCMFLSLLHSVQSFKYVVNVWIEALNALTWVEILRQVLLAAGYGSTDGTCEKEAPDEHMSLMARYGLCPGTLKGELFSILLEEGNQGVRVSDLAESSRILNLNLAKGKDRLEELISSTLASDITLFEKIFCSTFRLRHKNLLMEDTHSDPEDSGSIDYSPKGSGFSRDNDDTDCDFRRINLSKSRNSWQYNREININSPGTEIDESQSGEAWMLGLMEGEYSDLSIEEKLNIMVALVDLLCAGSSIRLEDAGTTTTECVPKFYQHESGAKIKRASASQHTFYFPEKDRAVQSLEMRSLTEIQPLDSACVLRGKDISASNDLHPMQSIFLGSDRRYNRYWIFLGPCHADDPGHRRIYFESSEDGHFEVIDTKEALYALVEALDDRGRREAVLLASLKKRASILCDEISAGESTNVGDRLPTQSVQSELDRVHCDSSSPVSDVDNHSCLNRMMLTCSTSSSVLASKFGKNVEEDKLKWSRLQAFDLWIWNTFNSSLHSVKHKKHSYLDTLMRCEACHDLYWRDEKHCRFCHVTFELDFDLEEKYVIHTATCQAKEDTNLFPKHKVLPSVLQALKAAVHAIELAMPESSLIGAWTKSAHKLWIKRLRRTSSLQELSQALGNFVDAINKDWLSQCNATADCNSISEDIVTCFRNIPPTSSALALWLVKLDALVASQMQRNKDVKL